MMKRRPLDWKSPYSADSLRQLLAPILKEPRRYAQAMPDDAALSRLADKLNWIREWHLIEQAVAPGNAERRTIKTALDVAAEALDRLKIDETQFLDLAERSAALNPEISHYAASAGAIRTHLDELNWAGGLIAHIGNLQVLHERTNGVRSFIAHKEQITEAFAEAMRSANPKFRGGAGHNGDGRSSQGEGPTSRFLRAVLPSLTGEIYTLGTIAKYIRKNGAPPNT